MMNFCTLGNGVVGQSVHAHGDAEILQVVEKLAKNFELVEGDALFVLDPVKQSVQKHVIPTKNHIYKLMNFLGTKVITCRS